MNRKIKKVFRTFQTHFPFLCNQKSHIQRLYRKFFHVPFEMDFWALEKFPACSDHIFVDIGGNRGQSIDAIRLFFPKVTLHSFEPNPLLHTMLVQQFSKDENLFVHKLALGKNPGNYKLFIPVYRGYVFDGLASLDYASAHGWLKNNIMGYREELLTIQEEECEVKKFDDLGLRPFFMKIDIEGYELEALQGAVETLRECQPILLVEAVQYHPEILTFVEAFGYQVYAYENETFLKGKRKGQNSFLMTLEKRALLDSVDPSI